MMHDATGGERQDEGQENATHVRDPAPTNVPGRTPRLLAIERSSSVPSEPVRSDSLSDMKEHGFSTRAIHTHLPETVGVASDPIAIPIYQTASFEFDRAEDLGKAIHRPEDSFMYSRLSNPTVAALENALADLERGDAALAFSSGMAAIHCALIHELSAGDHAVAPSALYGGSFQLLRRILPRFGIETTFVDHHDLGAWKRAMRPNTKIVYAETIGNPTLFVPDLRALSEIAHAGGAKLIVDSTFASPYLCRPLELGADVVMHSASKFLGGHGDLVAGLLAGSKGVIDSMRHTAYEVGGTMSPFIAWLILRGLMTLPVRMERHSSTAMQLARWLEAHPRVTKVHYPGLPSHPNHAIAKAELGERFGGMLAFELPDRQSGARFVDRLQLIKRAGSLGDVRSLIIQPSNTTHRQLSPEELRAAHISEGFIRFSVGLEDPADLVSDLEQALVET
jgi:methionine-gamma-lyase